MAPDGSLYIADSSNHRVRRVSPDGIITTVAGDWREPDFYAATAGRPPDAELDRPQGWRWAPTAAST